MISSLGIYGILLLDNVIGFLVILAIILAVIFCIVFYYGAEEAEKLKTATERFEYRKARPTSYDEVDIKESENIVNKLRIEDNKNSKHLFYCAFLFLLIAVVIVFIPSTNQMAMIYVIPKLSNSDFAKNIPGKLEKLAEKELDSLLKTDKEIK